MALDFAKFDLSEIFETPDITEIELDCCLWMDSELALDG